MIEIKQMCKSYDEKTIFKDFNLLINDGEFIAIKGPSGCGKTTLLNIIGGLENPDAGTILVNGKNIKHPKEKRDYFLNQVSFLFQNFVLMENKTVIENIDLVSKKQRTKTTPLEALKIVGLEDKEKVKVYKLSGGEQQRVALARLLIKKSNIILADEPTGSLDEKNAILVMEILKKLNDDGKIVIVVTHSNMVASYAERVIQL